MDPAEVDDHKTKRGKKRTRDAMESEAKRVATGVEGPPYIVVNVSLEKHVPANFPAVEQMLIIQELLARRDEQGAQIRQAHYELQLMKMRGAASQEEITKSRHILTETRLKAVGDNIRMRNLYMHLFRFCAICEVRHYIRADFNCADHQFEPICTTICTTCGVKHRYPNMATNANDRRCTDNVFEAGEIRGVFCTTCKYTVWEVPGAPFGCIGCGRFVKYVKRRGRFSFAKTAAGLPSTEDDVVESGDEEPPDSKRVCVRLGVLRVSPFPGADLGTLTRDAVAGDTFFDAPSYGSMLEAGGPTPAMSSEDVIATMERLHREQSLAVAAGDWRTYSLLQQQERTFVAREIADDAPIEQVDAARTMFGKDGPDFVNRGCVLSPSAEQASLIKAMQYCWHALRLQGLIETAQNQRDMDGSVEEDVENEINDLLESLPLLFVNNGFAGVSVTVASKAAAEESWLEQVGTVPLEVQRLTDSVGVSVLNNSKSPIVVHCADRNGKDNDVVELNGQQFLELAPGSIGDNKRNASVRWVSDAEHCITNFFGIVWRFADEPQWKFMVLPYNVVAAKRGATA